MSRINSGGYGHRIRREGCVFVLSWTYDKSFGRMRYPRRISRDTDRAGAERFARKWGCAMPVEAK